MIAATLSPSVPGLPLVERCGPLRNNGRDNQKYELILCENQTFTLNEKTYRVENLLGSGSFSNVYQISVVGSDEQFAMKVGKSDQNSTSAMTYEISVLRFIKQRSTSDAQSRFCNCKEVFILEGHTCIIMELLGQSVWDMLSQRDHIGMTFKYIQSVLASVLETLLIFESISLAHCDVKPENILQNIDGSLTFKLVDYGICTPVRTPVVSYIQSIYYRAPEVIVQIPFTCKADIWSLGCVAAEMFFGIPLFCCECELHLMHLMNMMVGPFPESFVEKITGTQKNRYFLSNKTMKSAERLCSENGEDFDEGNEYFWYDTLYENLMMYTTDPNGVLDLTDEDKRIREIFADLLANMLKLDPSERYSASDALNHPFMRIEF